MIAVSDSEADKAYKLFTDNSTIETTLERNFVE